MVVHYYHYQILNQFSLERFNLIGLIVFVTNPLTGQLKGKRAEKNSVVSP